MKLVSIDWLAAKVSHERKARWETPVVGMANGCFDLIHVGHIKHLQAAKEICDILCVMVTQDEHVNKGPGRPIFTAKLRCEALAALECVDYVCVNSPKPGESILAVRPDLYIKGNEYKDNITPPLQIEKDAVESYGGKLVFTNEIEFHSTRLIETIRVLEPTDENPRRAEAYSTVCAAFGG